jgi:hypothetical protein
MSDDSAMTRFAMFIAAAAEADSVRLQAHMKDQHPETPTADHLAAAATAHYKGEPQPYQPVWPTAASYRAALDEDARIADQN